MATLLHLKSSIFGENGQSSGLSNPFVEDWRAQHPDGNVVVRDLAAAPLPHLDAVAVGGFMTAMDDRSAEQAVAVARSDELIAEISGAEVIVIALPMYNFGIPSTLKAWIDHIARAGVTFRYTENGPEGLLTGKKAYVFAARGGLYAGTSNDTQTPYIENVLGFVGINDVTIIAAEGLNMGDEAKAASLSTAHGQITALSGTLSAVA